MKKFKVCLTGGIASGKTYVSDKLAASGAYVIDADILARQVVEKGSRGLALIVDEFGSSILAPDRSLNRQKLKELVFSDHSKLKLLNSIVHPLVRKSFEITSQLSKARIEVWVIPLLSKESEYLHFNRILAVDVKESIQIKRVSQRDQINPKIAQSIISSQPTRSERLDLATDVIANNKDFASLDISIGQVFNLFKALTHQQSR